MQGLKTPTSTPIAAIADLPQLSTEHQTEHEKTEHQNYPDRRNRVHRRRTRNHIFEARARRLGMAIDRRRSRNWITALLRRGAALWPLQREAQTRAHDATAANSH